MPCCASHLRTLLISAAHFASLVLAGTAASADRLILRNLDILTDHTVTAIDEEGLRLDKPRSGGGDRVFWDEVERATIALDQAKCDSLLKELGQPLYRIRQRLKIGDYESLAEPAELLYPRYAALHGRTAYMVCQAVMWSRLATNRREAAVEPCLRCYELLRSGAAHPEWLPGQRRLEFDAQSAITPDLLPVWFDAEAAKAALPGVEEAIRGMQQPRPEGAYAYYTSLALAAGDTAAASRVLTAVRGESPATAPWRAIVLAQQAIVSGESDAPVDALRAAAASFPEPARPAALYWLGRFDAQAAAADQCRDGLLALLTLPAEYGRTQPELAAAGLYHAAAALDKLKDDRGANAVRYELTVNYPQTYFASRFSSEAKGTSEAASR